MSTIKLDAMSELLNLKGYSVLKSSWVFFQLAFDQISLEASLKQYLTEHTFVLVFSLC